MICTLWAAGLAGLGCQSTYNPLMAKRIENNEELIGGPGAVAGRGDFIMANDRIRVAILAGGNTAGPGLFGGSVADIDLVRDGTGSRQAAGKDSFAQIFPMANVYMPEPDVDQVTVLEDGSDGERAVIRVVGRGGMMLDALRLIDSGFPMAEDEVIRLQEMCGLEGLITDVEFQTDYILEPGVDYLRMETVVNRAPARNTADQTGTFDDFDNDGIPDSEDSCPLDPSAGIHYLPGLTGECREPNPATCAGLSELVEGPLPLAPFTEESSANIFRIILGNLALPQSNAPGAANLEENSETNLRPGLIGGDFIYFGHTSRVFLPGFGFDESGGLASYTDQTGKNTVMDPIPMSWLAASGDGVSYAIGNPEGKLLAPLFASSATAAFFGKVNCNEEYSLAGDSSQNGKEPVGECNGVRSFSFTRYLAVGDGDVASAVAGLEKLGGATMVDLEGAIFEEGTSRPIDNASIFLMRVPATLDRAQVDALLAGNMSYDQVAALNRAEEPRLGPGLLMHMATSGDGSGEFSAKVKTGTYLAVAWHQEHGVSNPIPIRIAAEDAVDGPLQMSLLLPPAGEVRVRVTDHMENPVPARLVITSNAPIVQPRPELGGTPFVDGVVQVVHIDGDSGRDGIERTVRLPVGATYRITATRGFEYEIDTREITIQPGGGATSISLSMAKSVDTTGWISADFHQHTVNSFDSAVTGEQRVLSNMAAGLTMVVPTDHDVITNLEPVINKNGWENQIAVMPGVEVSTLEMGHFLGFPVRYRGEVPNGNGAPDWYGMDYAPLLQSIRDIASPMSGGRTVLAVAHPRDGLLGYLDQIGFDQFSLKVEPGMMASTSPAVEHPSCNFDAMEVLSSKNLSQIRTPTVGAVREYAWRLQCLEELALTGSELTAYKKAVDDVLIRRLLTRTPEEQEAWLNTTRNPNRCKKADLRFDSCSPCNLYNVAGEEALCEDTVSPCDTHPGMMEDWFRFLNGSLPKEQNEYASDEIHAPTALGNSDTHNTTLSEVGYPRNYIKVDSSTAAYLEPDEVVSGALQRQVSVSAGPFVELWANDHPIGHMVQVETAGEPVTIRIKVQAPSWMQIDRVELYRNGALIRELTGDRLRFDQAVRLDYNYPDDPGGVDSWYVAVATGTSPNVLPAMGGVISSTSSGQLNTGKLVEQILQAFPAATMFYTPAPPLPSSHQAYPYAVTNPVWVDADGDGQFTPPRPFTICPAEN